MFGLCHALPLHSPKNRTSRVQVLDRVSSLGFEASRSEVELYGLGKVEIKASTMQLLVQYRSMRYVRSCQSTTVILV